MSDMPPIAILAGGGTLPELLAQAASKSREVVIVSFGRSLPWAEGLDQFVVEFEKPGALFRALKGRGISDVVFAGYMTRPELNPIRFDVTMWKLAGLLLPALKSGDDITLRTILAMFEERGFRILSAQDVAPDLLVNRNMKSNHKLSAQDRRDIDRGVEILKSMSAADVGQGCVVSNGLCLGMETIQGTNAMLDFVAKNKTSKGGVFIKAPKIDQDQRVDMPTVGPETIKAAANAKLNGVALIENGALVIDRSEIIDLANKNGLFITVLHAGLL